MSTTQISARDYDDEGKVALICHLLIRDRNTGEVLVNQRDLLISRKAFQSDDEQSPRPKG